MPILEWLTTLAYLKMFSTACLLYIPLNQKVATKASKCLLLCVICFRNVFSNFVSKCELGFKFGYFEAIRRIFQT